MSMPCLYTSTRQYVRQQSVLLLNASTHPFNGPLSRTTQVSQYQEGKTNLDLTEARDSEWQWHQVGHMQICTSLQTDNNASTPLLIFLQAGCPSCRPTNSIKALKAVVKRNSNQYRDLVAKVSRPRSWLNKLKCTRVLRPWSQITTLAKVHA